MRKIFEKNEKLLIGLLEKEEQRLFLDYVDAYSEVLAITGTVKYVDGFCVGAKLMLEINEETTLCPISRITVF